MVELPVMGAYERYLQKQRRSRFIRRLKFGSAVAATSLAATGGYGLYKAENTSSEKPVSGAPVHHVQQQASHPAIVPAPTALVNAALHGPNVVGVQDSSINDCDAYETYQGQNPNYGLAAEAFNNPLYDGLHVSTVRYSAPWDIAYHDTASPGGRILENEQLCMDWWLAKAAQHHQAVQISFKPDYNYTNAAGTKILAPDIATYNRAIKAFIAQYSMCTDTGGTAATCNLPKVPAGWPQFPDPGAGMARVMIISPWGEPNFTGKSGAGLHHLPQAMYMPKGGGTLGEFNCRTETVDTCGPVLAAQMWVTLHRDCPECVDIAGTFSGSGGLEPFDGNLFDSYLAKYARHLSGNRPQVWVVDPYPDTSSKEWNAINHLPMGDPRWTITGMVANALAQLGFHHGTQLWFGEASAWFKDMYHHHQFYGQGLQAKAGYYLLHDLPGATRTTPNAPQVTRIYYMRFADGAVFPNYALVVDGRPHDIYYTIACRPPFQATCTPAERRKGLG